MRRSGNDQLAIIELVAVAKTASADASSTNAKAYFVWHRTALPFSQNSSLGQGVIIKLQFSMRERPILPVVGVAQIKQDYFENLGFEPAAIPSLAFEEAVAEKIRAASQRSKIRDLHDLSEIAARDINRALIRSLAVLKLWNSGGPGFDYGRFVEKVCGAGDYDVDDLTNLLRKDQKPDLESMMKRVVEGFRFLVDLGEAELTLAADTERKKKREADALIAAIAPAAVVARP